MTTDLVIPDEVEPTVGWRAWSYTASGLCSPQQGTHWPAQERLEAGCVFGGGHFQPTPPQPLWAPVMSVSRHEAPAENCNCGIHASSIPSQASDYAAGLKVVGTVKLWGRVVEGEWGWRAEYAYPDRLWVIGPDREETREIAALISSEYGVPVEVSTLDVLLEQASNILPVDPAKVAAFNKAQNEQNLGYPSVWGGSVTPGFTVQLSATSGPSVSLSAPEESWLERNAYRLFIAAAALNIGSALLNLWVSR